MKWNMKDSIIVAGMIILAILILAAVDNTLKHPTSEYWGIDPQVIEESIPREKF